MVSVRLLLARPYDSLVRFSHRALSHLCSMVSDGLFLLRQVEVHILSQALASVPSLVKQETSETDDAGSP